MQTGKLVKVFVYLKGKRIEIEPDEARALLAQLKATFGEPQWMPTPTLPSVPYPRDGITWFSGGVADQVPMSPGNTTVTFAGTPGNWRP